MAERERNKKRKYYERLYKINVLPNGNLNSINTMDVVNMKLENPPLDDDETDKGTV